VRELFVGESELRLQVGLELSLLGASLDGGQQLLVNIDLRALALIIHGVLLFFCLEDLAISGLLLLGLDAIEELVVQVLRQIDLADVNFGACGDHVDLIDATQWASIDLEWTADKQKAGFELFEENNAFSSMTASDKNEHCTRRN